MPRFTVLSAQLAIPGRRLTRLALVILTGFLLCPRNALAQEITSKTFEYPDRVVKVTAHGSISVEKHEDNTLKLSYKIDAYIDPESYEDRRFVEIKTTLAAPRDAYSATLDMLPFENPAQLHVWNPDDRTAYISFDGSEPTVVLGDMNYKGSEEKFMGKVKAFSFSTVLSTEMGEHEVLVRSVTLE